MFPTILAMLPERPCLWVLIPLFVFLQPGSVLLHGQTIDDGIMMPKGNLFAGYLYTHDSWDHYWEGSLKRVNGNIGTVTTQAHTWSGNYGVTDRINVIASVPHVRTNASDGVLRGMSGIQDLTLAGKYSFFERRLERGLFRAIGVVSGAIPLTDYTPDFMPMSIGTASKRISTRLTLNFLSNGGLYLAGSNAYTWRGDVSLDRPYYFTDGRLTFSDKADMPDVYDYTVSGGYMRRGWMAIGSFSQQRTQGGGDIRRQDMPFVSNRMNFSRVGGMLMFPVPKLSGIFGQAAYAYNVEGRNVGQASTLTVGVMYRFRFPGVAR